jgi:hypothetical protein
MAIPPQYEDPEMSRPYFITLRRLAERINKEGIPGASLRDLSMGMSNDFEVAIEEGATMIRVGTAIFGPRDEEPLKGPEKKEPVVAGKLTAKGKLAVKAKKAVKGKKAAKGKLAAKVKKAVKAKKPAKKTAGKKTRGGKKAG